jgi:hypothetical protein
MLRSSTVALQLRWSASLLSRAKSKDDNATVTATMPKTKTTTKGRGASATPTPQELPAEVLDLLRDPAVLAHLRDVRRQFNNTSDNAATVAIKTSTTQPNLAGIDFSTFSASSAAATTAPSRSKKAPTPPNTVVHSRAARGGAAISIDVGWRAPFVQLPSVKAALTSGMSPWTAAFRFKPALNVRGQCNFASHHRHMLEARFTTDNLQALENQALFPVRWVATAFAESFNAPLRGDIGTEAAPVTLPAYPYVLAASGDERLATKSEIDKIAARRTFRPLSAYAETSHETMVPTDPPLCARCGETGKFFSREEMVDALLYHAALKQYRNPFWISLSHPKLKSGFLELKPESKPCLVQSVALVFPASRIPIKGADEPRSYLHPAWIEKKTRQPGMNAFTGAVAENAALRTGDFAEGWVTLDQLLMAGMQIPRDTSKAVTREDAFGVDEPCLDGGVFAIVQELALYNADQLEKPGRLALIADSDRAKAPNSMFKPLFV